MDSVSNVREKIRKEVFDKGVQEKIIDCSDVFLFMTRLGNLELIMRLAGIGYTYDSRLLANACMYKHVDIVKFYMRENEISFPLDYKCILIALKNDDVDVLKILYKKSDKYFMEFIELSIKLNANHCLVYLFRDLGKKRSDYFEDKIVKTAIDSDNNVACDMFYYRFRQTQLIRDQWKITYIDRAIEGKRKKVIEWISTNIEVGIDQTLKMAIQRDKIEDVISLIKRNGKQQCSEYIADCCDFQTIKWLVDKQIDLDWQLIIDRCVEYIGTFPSEHHTDVGSIEIIKYVKNSMLMVD